MKPMRHNTAGIFAFVFLLGPLSVAHAQVVPDQSSAELELTELLKVRAVTGARHDQRIVDSPRQIVVLTADDIRRRNYRSTPDALADMMGVFVQETNDGGGSPIIRGLVGNQVLIMVDGIRLNNSSFRLGPNQYLNTIDLNQIERIEVVRGAGSVLYGSDALGGVVNIITKAAGREKGTGAVGTRWFSRLSSANTGAIGRGEVSLQTGALGFVGGLTLKSFGALHGGRDTGVQTATGYDEWDGDAKAVFQLAAHQKIIVAGQRVTQRHVQRADIITSGTDLKWMWNPETRGLLYAQYTASDLPGPVEQVSATVSYQEQAEHYQRIASSAPTLEMRHFDRTRSLGTNLQFTSPVGPRHLLTYGVDVYGDRMASQREDVSLTTGESTLARGNFADGARYRSAALFLQDEIDVSPRLLVNLGARYSSFHPNAVVSDPSTGSAAHRFAAARLDRLRPRALPPDVGRRNRRRHRPGVSRAQHRRPDDSRQNREPVRSAQSGPRTRAQRQSGSGDARPASRRHRQRHVLPHRNRRPHPARAWHLRRPDVPGPRWQRRQEQQRAADLSASERGARADSGRRARGAGAPGGSVDIVREGGPDGRHGTDHWRATAAYSSNVRQSRRRVVVRPTRVGGRVSVFASRQTRLAPGDLTDVRIPAGGTPGFLTLNARGGVTISQTLQATLGLENLTNRTYRTHGSGIDGAGINVIFGIDWMF